MNFTLVMQSSFGRDVPRVVNVSRATRDSGVPMNYDFDDHLDQGSSNRIRGAGERGEEGRVMGGR